MSHQNFPIAILLATLLVVVPGQSFATSMGADASSEFSSKSNNKDDDKLKEILKEIFTLGGIFDGRSKGGSRDPSEPGSEIDEGLGSGPWTGHDMAGEIFRLPIIYPEDPTQGGPNLAAPVPEPTGALLFGMGILAVASRRAHLERLR